jgi:hypothetical protein
VELLHLHPFWPLLLVQVFRVGFKVFYDLHCLKLLVEVFDTLLALGLEAETNAVDHPDETDQY